MSNHKHQIDAKKQRIEGYIMPLLGWSTEHYQDFKMRCGCSFLQNYIPHSPAFIDELIETKIFWQWWNNEWLLRDEGFTFFSHLHFPPDQRVIVGIFKSMHDPSTLAKQLQIDSLVFENTSITKKPTL